MTVPQESQTMTLGAHHWSGSSRFLFWGGAVGFLFVSFCMALLGHIGKYIYLFSTLYVLAFLLLFALIKTFPGDWPVRKQLVFVLLMSTVVHFAFLVFPASFDVNRYVWEGYLLNKGVNPFVYAPDNPILTPFIKDMQDIWQDVNHKNASACYPPLAMLLFRFAASLSPTRFFFNMIVILFNLAAIGVLTLLARAYKLPMSRVLLYALNPVVLVFIAGEGHLDSIQIFFMCLCLYYFVQKKEHWGFFFLGCAVMSKYFSVLLLPFFINAKNWKKSIVLFGTVVMLYLPFWNTGRHLFTSLAWFGTVMHYNDSITVLLRDIFGTHATLISAVLLGMCLVVIFLLVHDPVKSSYIAVGCLLLLIATLHPWYLTLITPFLVFFPSRAWLYLHIAVVFTFPILHVEYFTSVFQEIHWVKLFEYIPFYGLLIWDAFKNTRIFGTHNFQPVRTISVIIPTLNESENIASCIETFRGDTIVAETIVVDGGSTDNTRAIARKMGAQVFQTEKGRGIQIKAAVSRACGDILLILHADCLIHKEIPSRMLQILNHNSQYIGGSVGMSYLHRTVSNRWIAWLNNTRARWTGIAFGDQAQFFRKDALARIGGFPGMMLMEDIELSLRLKEQGQICFISKGVTVSNRRWEKKGFWGNIWCVLWLSCSYLVQRRLGIGDPERRDFYKRYYSAQHV